MTFQELPLKPVSGWHFTLSPARPRGGADPERGSRNVPSRISASRKARSLQPWKYVSVEVNTDVVDCIQHVGSVNNP
jgi:hypothetical protein